MPKAAGCRAAFVWNESELEQDADLDHEPGLVLRVAGFTETEARRYVLYVDIRSLEAAKIDTALPSRRHRKGISGASRTEAERVRRPVGQVAARRYIFEAAGEVPIVVDVVVGQDRSAPGLRIFGRAGDRRVVPVIGELEIRANRERRGVVGVYHVQNGRVVQDVGRRDAVRFGIAVEIAAGGNRQRIGGIDRPGRQA